MVSTRRGQNCHHLIFHLCCPKPNGTSLLMHNVCSCETSCASVVLREKKKMEWIKGLLFVRHNLIKSTYNEGIWYII